MLSGGNLIVLVTPSSPGETRIRLSIANSRHSAPPCVWNASAAAAAEIYLLLQTRETRLIDLRSERQVLRDGIALVSAGTQHHR